MGDAMAATEQQGDKNANNATFRIVLGYTNNESAL